jgi:hypothetical protein
MLNLTAGGLYIGKYSPPPLPLLYKNFLIYSKYLCSEADKQKKVKSPTAVEEERSASKRRRNSSSASTDNPVQGKQKLTFLR